MKKQWQSLSIQFLALSPREQALIFISGLVAIFMLPYTLAIESNMNSITKDQQTITKLTKSNKSLQININEFDSALAKDPNVLVKKQIEDYENRLGSVDEKLLTLTSELIDPIQMRLALIQLLKLQRGVSLLALDVVPAQPLIFNQDENKAMNKDVATAKVLNNVSNIDGIKNALSTENQIQPVEQKSLGLYRHSIRVKLSGSYFQLRDYLVQLESLPWKFFWHDFKYELKQYPVSELEIEIYSLSTNQEFVGV
jgi:MSHA biogenesis protein MshJ